MLRGGVVIIIVFLGDYHSLTEMNIGDLCPIMLVSLCLTLSYYVASGRVLFHLEGRTSFECTQALLREELLCNFLRCIIVSREE